MEPSDQVVHQSSKPVENHHHHGWSVVLLLDVKIVARGRQAFSRFSTLRLTTALNDSQVYASRASSLKRFLPFFGMPL
jgi:hypothetical protein